MKYLIYILLLVSTANAQTTFVVPTPGVDTVITLNSKDYRLFLPPTYNSLAHVNCFLHWAGLGETTVSLMTTKPMAKWFAASWDGTVHMNDGTIESTVWIGIPHYGVTNDLTIATSIENILAELTKIDTVNSLFGSVGYSQGVLNMWAYFNGNHNSSVYRNWFSNITINNSCPNITTQVSTANIGIISSGGIHLVSINETDPNSLTDPSYSQALYDKITSPARKKLVTANFGSHTGWDSILSVSGAMVQNGNDADHNSLRWVFNENDTITVTPPVDAIRVRGIKIIIE